MKSLLLAIATLVLLLGVTTWSQPYELDWTHRTVPAQTSAVVQPPPVKATVPASPLVHSIVPAKAQKSTPAKVADPITVQITAEQSYDHYKSRYRKVARVESLIYRGGYPQDQTHCNRAQYDWFDIYLEDLEVGDRYKVRVTWDDGSHRTIERTIGPLSETSVFIREPLAYDAGFES